MSGNQKKLKSLLPKPTEGNEINHNKAIFPQSTLTNYRYSFLDGTNSCFSSLSPSFLKSSNVNIIENSFTTQSLLNTARLSSISILGDKTEAIDLTSNNKRTLSQPNLCKKSKLTDQINDDENNIDSDLIALVKSIEPVESLNSDSSGDTVIKDVINTESSHSLLAGNKISPKILSAPVSSSHLCSSIQDNGKNISSTPLLKEHYSKSLYRTLDLSNNTETSVTTNPFSRWKTTHMKRKTPLNSFMYDSELLLSNNNLSTDKSSKSFVPSSVKSLTQANKQFYASMGLDEDLCDVKPKFKENKLPEPTSHQFLNASMSCNSSTSEDFLKLPIKKEKNASPPSSPCAGEVKSIQNSNSNLLLNDMHISMTFEADPYDIDDEDDLPLSFFKCKSSGDENAEIKPKCQQINKIENTACELLPTFIKKELIEEDEILSVTDCNFPVVSAEKELQNNIEINSMLNTDLTQNNKIYDLSPVKIKTEPTTEFENFISVSNNSASGALNQPLPDIDIRKKVEKKSPKKNPNNKKKTSKNKKNVSKADLHMSVENKICDNNLSGSLSVSFNLLESVKEKSPNQLIENVNVCDTLIASSCPSSENNPTQSPKKLPNKAKKSVSTKNSTVKKKNENKTSKPKKCLTDQQTSISSNKFPDTHFDIFKSPHTDSMAENIDVLFSDSSLNSTKNEVSNKKGKKNNVKKTSKPKKSTQQISIPSNKFPDTCFDILKSPHTDSMAENFDVSFSDCSLNSTKHEVPNKKGKKKNVKKTSKPKKSTQQISIPSNKFPDASFDILKSPLTDSMTENFDGSFSDSSLNSTKNEVSNKKGKKKFTKNEDNLDENLPITLLIKRQQSDSSIQSSDSFLCTTVNKPVFSESKITDVNEKLEDNHEKFNSYSPRSSNSSIISSNASLSLLGKVFQIKGTPETIKNSNIECPKLKKNASKKKISTKKGKAVTNKNKVKGISNKLKKTVFATTLNPMSQLASPHDASFSDNSFSSSNFNEDTCKMPNITNNNTLVHVEIEEQDSSSEESSTPLFNLKNVAVKQSTISPNELENAPSLIKNIKTKNDLISDSESKSSKQSGYATPDTQLISLSSSQDTPSSEITSPASNISNQQKINDIGPHPSESEKNISPLKKKRRTKKSHNWYKKKKAKKKIVEAELLNSVSEVNLMTAAEVFEEPVPKQYPIAEVFNVLRESEVTSDVSENANTASKVNTNIVTISKMPVVLIKNLETDEPVKFQNDKITSKIAEQEEPANMNIEQEEILPVSAKRKRRKRAGNARKRKKVSNVNKNIMDSSETFEDTNKNTETIVDSDSNLVRSINKDSDNLLLLDAVSKVSSEEAYIPFKELPVIEKDTSIITIEDSPNKPCSKQNRKFFPSLSVDTIQKDIEGLESFIAAAEHSKFKKDNLGNEIVPQRELKQNINRPSSSDTSSINNLYKTSNVTKNSIAFETTSEQPHVKSIFTASPVEVKKEKSFEDMAQDNSMVNLCDNNLAKNIFSNVQNDHNSVLLSSITPRTEQTSVNVVDRPEPYSSDISQSVSILNKNTSRSSCQENFLNGAIGFSVKKETFTKTKSISSMYGLIKNVDNLHEKTSNIQNYFANAPQPNPKSSSGYLSSKTSNSSIIVPEPTLSSNVENIVDDEIVLIEPTPKVVPCVDLDLSDDEPTNLMNINKSLFNSVKSQAVQEKAKVNLIISNSATQSEHSLNQIPRNKLLSSNHQKQIESSMFDLSAEDKAENVGSDHFLDGGNKEFSDTEKVTIDSLVAKEKYLNEYFRCPFPPSVSFQYRQRGKNEIYSRINSQSLNLSVEKVATRLRNSSNIKYQFGNKLGDIVKLEKYPVSASEVECYHRILGIAPSHDLLSKCFKASDKNSFEMNEFRLYKEFGESVNSNTSGNKLPSHMFCSLNDIIQGINESRIMSDNLEILDQNCPSADTRDSFESHFSSVSDTSFAPNKGIVNFKVLNESKQPNLYQDISSNSQNTILSAITTDLQNESQMTNNNTCISKNLGEMNSYNLDTRQNTDSQNILSRILIPTKDTLDSTVNNNASNELISVVKSTNESNADIFPELIKKSFTNDIQKALPDQNALPATVPFSLENPCVTPNKLTSVVKSNADFSPELAKESFINDTPNSLTDPHLPSTVPFSLQSPTSNKGSSLFQSTSNLIFDLDVPDLRKILEVASSFPVNLHNTSNASAVDTKNNVWENKETFEYNHTCSIPITDINSEHNKEDIDDISFSDKTCAAENPLSVSNHDNDRLDISDDDCVDNEPIIYESDEKNEYSDIQKDEDEPIIPEYKSKWEKIMERKALEKKEKVNEHLLKDCFPVSSKVPNKKLNVSNKNTKKCSNQKEVLKKDECIKTKDKPDPKFSYFKKLSHESKKIETSKDKIVKDSNVGTKKKNVKKTKDISKSGKIIVNDSDLFTPDKPVTKSQEKSTKNFDDKKNKASKKFYGNRVTNRGTFLTESSEHIKAIKIPQKKNVHELKKPTSVRSEEFHSMVKSPNIHLESKHPKHNVNKSDALNSYQKKEIYNTDSFLNTQFSTSSDHPRKEYNQIPVHTTNPRDPRQADLPIRNYMHPRSLADIPFSDMKEPLNMPAASFYNNDGLLPNKKSPLLSTPSTSFHLNDNPYLYKAPLLNTPSSIPLKGPLENAPPIAFLQNILKSIQSSDSSMTGKDGILPLPKTVISSSNNSQLPSFTPGFEELTNSSTHSDVTSIPLLNKAYKTDLPVKDFNVQNSIQRNFTFQTQLDSSIAPQGLMSSNTPINQNNLLPQTNKKAASTCLVPQHLKNLVGHSTIETANVRLLMLEWSVDWLMQQQKNRNPPPISKSLKKVVSSYDNFEDHYNTYFPLMMLDTWHRIFVSWTHLSQASPYFCDITSYSVKSTYVSVECQTIFNITAHPKGVFPDEGSILMIKYGTKSNDFTIKILGYVTNVKTRHFNQVTDSRLCNFKPPQDGNFDVLQVLTLSYMGAYNSEDIDKRLPVRIHVLCNVKATLKQNDALLYINKSPLLKSILNPIEDGELRSVALPPRNSSQDKVNECVRDISKGILSLHPLAQITVVRAVPQSDRLNIIPMLISKIKKVYRFKVLLCVRTVRALGDIAANICLHESLKLVIINKRCDTSLQFQKFLLDELVTAERSSTSESIPEHLYSKNEVAIKTKKQILEDCDVVLSLIRNCHDEFMELTFRDTECVAQMCCIIDEANLCTEPETLIPILHGISKLILIGDPDYPAKVLSKTASSYDYNRSFFHRAHDLDLITE